MRDKYAELVQFYRDKNNEVQLQKAINEYQIFSKILNEIEYTFNINTKEIPQGVEEKLTDQLR